MTIHKAIFKYGKKNFTFEIIEKVPQNMENVEYNTSKSAQLLIRMKIYPELIQ